jgi:hypothetical protein
VTEEHQAKIANSLKDKPDKPKKEKKEKTPVSYDIYLQYCWQVHLPELFSVS